LPRQGVPAQELTEFQKIGDPARVFQGHVQFLPVPVTETLCQYSSRNAAILRMVSSRPALLRAMPQFSQSSVEPIVKDGRRLFAFDGKQSRDAFLNFRACPHKIGMIDRKALGLAVAKYWPTVYGMTK